VKLRASISMFQFHLNKVMLDNYLRDVSLCDVSTELKVKTDILYETVLHRDGTQQSFLMRLIPYMY